MLPGPFEEPLFPLLVATEAGRHLAERGERVGIATARAVERSLDPVEFVAEPGVLADQLVELGLEVGAQPVQRRKMDLFLEREVGVERTMEAVERLLHLARLPAFEHAQRGRLERVEVAMLRGDAPRLVSEAEAESGLVALRHIARNSTAVL